MKPVHTSILVISDIEGSSGCWNRKAAMFKTKEWAEACVGMSLDVNAVVTGLYEAGAGHVRIQDFHRTGYNLLPELIDRRAELSSGYRMKPIPALGHPGSATGLIMLGMHASSGSKGFIAHTLTSRIKKITCNGTPLSEAELLCMVLSRYGIVPLLFSGGPVACDEAGDIFPGILTYAIDKNTGPESFEKKIWRDGLKKAAEKSVFQKNMVPYERDGPYRVVIVMRDGSPAAKAIAEKWHFPFQDDQVFIECPTVFSLMHILIQIVFLHPLLKRIMPLGLAIYHVYGRFGLHWVRSRLKKVK